MKISPVKNKSVREAIKKAYNHFNSDECDWQEGMDILAQLLGYEIENTEAKHVTVAEFMEEILKQKY